MASTSTLENVHKLDQPGRPVIKIEDPEEQDGTQISMVDIFNQSDEKNKSDLEDKKQNVLLTEVKRKVLINKTEIDGDRLIVPKKEDILLTELKVLINKTEIFGDRLIVPKKEDSLLTELKVLINKTEIDGDRLIVPKKEDILFTELKVLINKTEIDGDMLIVFKKEEESEDEVDFNATDNLQAREQLIPNFSKSLGDIADIPEPKVVPKRQHPNKDVNWGDIYKTRPSTDCKADMKKVVVTMAPKSAKTIHPHEFEVLSRNKYVCNHCKSTCKRKNDLERHIRYKHRDVTNMYQCPYCPYKSKWHIKHHILLKHKKEKDIHWFNCDLCDKKFKTKGHLTKHIIRCHLTVAQLGDNMKRCQMCPKMFKTSTALNTHVKFVHNNEPRTRRQCPFCEFNTRCAMGIQRHKEVHHPVSRQRQTYECEDCDYKTKFLFQLKQHRKIHKRLFCCEKCAYVAPTSERLKLHQVTHQATIDERMLKYRCDKCKYKTYRYYSLSVHKLNHLKPHQIEYFYCCHCEFKANRKDNLKSHVLRHFKKGEVDFQCFVCDFSTKKRTLLTEHLQQSHPKAQTSSQDL